LSKTKDNIIEKSRLDGLLFAILGDQTLVERWWNGKNKAFDNEQPIKVFEQQPERVRDYIFRAANLGGEYY
jgi:hypothetical protein